MNARSEFSCLAALFCFSLVSISSLSLDGWVRDLLSCGGMGGSPVRGGWGRKGEKLVVSTVDPPGSASESPASN